MSENGKRTECPLCGGREDEGHTLCFHCCACGYLQCCDYDGYYRRDWAKRLLQWFKRIVAAVDDARKK